MRNVMMVVPVLMKSCHVLLYANIGPATTQAQMMSTAQMKVAGWPVALEVALAKRMKGCATGLREVMGKEGCKEYTRYAPQPDAEFLATAGFSCAMRPMPRASIEIRNQNHATGQAITVSRASRGNGPRGHVGTRGIKQALQIRF